MKNEITFSFLAAVALELMVTPVHALSIQTSDSVRTDSNRSASDSTANGFSVTSAASAGSFSNLQQFNDATGVLMGVDAKLDTSGSLSYSRTSTALGRTTLNVNWGLPSGDSSATLASRISNGTTSTLNSYTKNINAPDALNSFVGNGNVASNVSYTVNANKLSGNGTVTGSYLRPPATDSKNSTATLTYTYLQHAAPSFDVNQQSVLNIDFGKVLLGDSVGDIAFNIFNMSGNDRIGLDLDSIVGTGDIAELYSDIASFSDLTSGLHNLFLASFLASDTGKFSANYLLNFSDADRGASKTRHSYQMELNLMGEVVRPIPEPSELALLASGFLGFWIGLRGRKIN